MMVAVRTMPRGNRWTLRAVDDEVKDLAGIVDRAYQSGLSVVLWLSAALVSISIVLVWRLVKPSAASPAPLAVRAFESPHR